VSAVRRVTISAARDRLGTIVHDVGRSSRPYEITRRGKPTAIIMSVDEFEGLQDTVEFLSDASAMRAIRRSERDVQAGRVRRWEDVKTQR